MTLKFLLYDWGGLNGALFEVINQSTPAIFMPLAWVFSNLLGNYWSAPLVMLGLWSWSRSTEESSRGLSIRLQFTRLSIAFGLALVVASALWPLVGIRLRLTLALYVMLVGWSRIAAGMHFPADVLAGFAVGWASVVAARPLASHLPRCTTFSRISLPQRRC